VLELARWMRFNLGEPGELNGVRYVSARTMREIHHPQLVGNMGNVYGPINTYGLGWDVTDYKGRRMLRHGGATDGMNTNLVLLPNENIGVVIVTNTFNRFMSVLAFHILDELLGEAPTDWNAQIWNSWQVQVAAAQSAKDAVDAARVQGTNPTLDLEAYTGTYHDPLYDTAEVYLQDGELRIRFWDDDTQVLALEHWHYDTFRAAWTNPAKREKFVYFTLGDDGAVELLNVTWTLRPHVLQVGIYPSDYTRLTRFVRE
jgi:CubicO group peptidase (beta-lactamase class C family)